MDKNIAESSFKEINLDNGFLVLEFLNDTTENQTFERKVDSSFIQLHFCLKGKGSFLFNNGSYRFDVLEKRCILLYNPQQILPIHLNVQPKSTLVSILITIKKFHLLFSNEAGYISFLSDDNKNKKYYDETAIKPPIQIVLQEILNADVNSTIKSLYIKGKVYELISLHFQKDLNKADTFCPFLVDEQDVIKIRKAKDIVIKNMTNPPSLQELASEVGLNLKKLKEGFKQLYGDSVFSFLLDYKMEYAKKLLESNQYNVNEVGSQVGYSTASHFISAFKKKFGITPKQYVMKLSN